MNKRYVAQTIDSGSRWGIYDRVAKAFITDPNDPKRRPRRFTSEGYAARYAESLNKQINR